MRQGWVFCAKGGGAILWPRPRDFGGVVREMLRERRGCIWTSPQSLLYTIFWKWNYWNKKDRRLYLLENLGINLNINIFIQMVRILRNTYQKITQWSENWRRRVVKANNKTIISKIMYILLDFYKYFSYMSQKLDQ